MTELHGVTEEQIGYTGAPGLKLLEITEMAALEAGRWFGKGDSDAAYRAAIDAMGRSLEKLQMEGLSISNQEQGEPLYFAGERPARQDTCEYQMDLAALPIEGADMLVRGLPNSISIAALAGKGKLFSPGPISCMERLAVGPAAKEAIDLEAPLTANLHAIARQLGREVSSLRVAILNRTFNRATVELVREQGARVILYDEGEVSFGLRLCMPGQGIDLLAGMVSSRGALLSGCAIKAMGGNAQVRLAPPNQREYSRARQLGLDLEKVLGLDDLVQGMEFYFATTGITDGVLLDGVRYTGGGARTHSLLLSSEQGNHLRYIRNQHSWDRLWRLVYDNRQRLIEENKS